MFNFQGFFSVVYYYCSEDSFSDRCLNTCSQYALSDCYFWHSFYYKSGKMSFFKQHETFSVTLWYIYVYLRFSNLSITISFFIFRCCIFRVILGFFRFRFEVNRFCCRFIVLTVKIRDVLLIFFFLIWSFNDTQSICTLLNILTGYGYQAHSSI